MSEGIVKLQGGRYRYTLLQFVLDRNGREIANESERENYRREIKSYNVLHLGVILVVEFEFSGVVLERVERVAAVYRGARASERHPMLENL